MGEIGITRHEDATWLFGVAALRELVGDRTEAGRVEPAAERSLAGLHAASCWQYQCSPLVYQLLVSHLGEIVHLRSLRLPSNATATGSRRAEHR